MNIDFVFLYMYVRFAKLCVDIKKVLILNGNKYIHNDIIFI